MIIYMIIYLPILCCFSSIFADFRRILVPKGQPVNLPGHKNTETVGRVGGPLTIVLHNPYANHGAGIFTNMCPNKITQFCR